MKTEAEKIVAAEISKARAEGAREFARQFGSVLAGLVLGGLLGLAIAWLAWLFWFAAVVTWTVLTSPLFIAGAELLLIFVLRWMWRLLHPKAE